MKWYKLWQHYFRKKSRNDSRSNLKSVEPTQWRVKHGEKGRRLFIPNFGGNLEATKITAHTASTSRAHWVFEVISGMDRGRQFIGMTDEIKIGRQFDNHIQLNDPKVSRFHAVILKKGASLMVRDLNSTNGTWINQEKVAKQQKVESGDQIRIGATVIVVHFEKE